MIKTYIESVKRDTKFFETMRSLSRLDGLEIVDDPANAEVILMTDDEAEYILKSSLFHKYKAKCLCINDGDILSYYLPSLYASNFRCFQSRGRSQTVGHYLSLMEDESGKRNIWINRLKDEKFEKRLLYSFMGGSTCWLRKRLLKQYEGCEVEDVLVKGTNHYKHWGPGDPAAKSAQQRLYVETMLSSKFALCPRGASASSIRLFEAMELGCAPVILADSWVPIDGVDWSFCLFIKESYLPNLDQIIRSHSDEWKERGAAARQTFDQNFAPAKLGFLLERQMRHLIETRSEAREQLIHLLDPLQSSVRQSGAAARATLRNLVLFGYRALGRDFPFELNRE